MNKLYNSIVYNNGKYTSIYLLLLILLECMHLNGISKPNKYFLYKNTFELKYITILMPVKRNLKKV